MRRVILALLAMVMLLAAFAIRNGKRANVNESPPQIVEIPDEFKGQGTPIELESPIPEPQFIAVDKIRDRINEDSIYADIINHSRNPVLNHDRDTNAHETTHMINSDIRNAHRRSNGFYIPGGKGVVIKEPNIRKRDLIPYIPKNLRSYRYSTYITGQRAWDDTPLYIFDEWVAYVNGAAVSVEDVEKGRHDGQWTDAVSGCLGFSIYSIALAMAVADKDPEYWENNQQFKDFLHWHLKRSYDTFQAGRNMDQFKWDKQEKLYANLLNDPEAEAIRRFLSTHFDGLWLDGKVSEGQDRWYGPISEFEDFYGATKIIKVNGTRMGIKHE